MPRYVKVKPESWVEMEKPIMGIRWRPLHGDCVGVYEVTDEDIINNAMKGVWHGYCCFAIERTEFETLLAFGIPLLNPKEKPPCTKTG